MDIEPTLCYAIIFSDSVIREHGTGKLSLIGSFTGYTVPTVPFVAPPFIVTVLVTNLQGRLERFPITVHVEAPRTGHILASSVAEISTDRDVARTDIYEVPIAIGPINYSETGIYKIKVLAQNEALGDRDLPVRTLATA